MKIRAIRRMLVVLLLLASLALLAWGLWPVFDQSSVLPIAPSDMQVPTPAGWVPALGLFG